MQTSYWSKVLSKRVSRRRAVVGTSAFAGAAAFLAACGSDDDEPASTGGGSTGSTGGGSTGSTGSTGGGATGATGSTGSSGLVTQPVDSFAQAVRGGVFKDFTNAEPNSLDPINPQADLNNLTAEVYQMLLTGKPGKLAPGAFELEGKLAESFEISPDGLQITFRLRKDAKWHNIAPVSGRAFDSEDVLYSLNRYAEFAPLRSLVWNSASPGGFALAPEAPDASTVIVKLTEPVAYAANWFADFGSTTGAMLMYPRESADENVLDIRQTQIGTGPLQLKEHVPSVRFIYERNPDYWDQDHILFDELNMPIIPEYAARQGQLKAGEIFSTDNRNNDILRGEDLLVLKNDQPKLQIYAAPFAPANAVMTFGYLGENYFQDERVRQAIAMSVDRDLDIDVRNNVVKLEEAGLPVRTAWNSHLAASDGAIAGGWYLDPQDSDFGPNAKYFQYNLEEAKKLLTAAGYPDGFDVRFQYPNAPQFNRQSVVVPFFAYLQELGLNVIDAGNTDYTQDYIPNNRDASGEFDGLAYHSITGSTPVVLDPTSAMVAMYLPSSGVTFQGFSADGSGTKSGDPALTEILQKAKLELDVDARRALIHEAQRYLGEKFWALPEAGGANLFDLAWPAVRNLWTNVGEAPWDRYQIWLDQTQAPFV